MDDITKTILEEINRVFEEEINSLNKVRSNLSSEYSDATQLISKANKLIISGIGKSGLIARKIAATFSSTGIPAIFMHPVEAMHGDLGIIQKNDVIILLSKSGSTADIVCLIPYLKKNQTKIIAIVGNTKSILARSADITIDASVEREACPFNLAPTSSTTVALAIGDALAMACMKINNINIETFSKLHPLGQIGRNISVQVKDIMHANSSLPFIGFDSSFKDAIIEISNKKLGCVLILDKESHLKGIITDGDVRRTLQKYDEINSLKASDLMTPNPVTINQDTFLSEALSLMEQRESQINVLPVVNEQNKCVGVIRIHDIIRSGL
jgi:arabinose-5-phosphate isomerase